MFNALKTFYNDLKHSLLSPAQTWSTYSNISYGITGTAVMLQGGAQSIYAGIMLCLLMISSGLFHGTGKYIWQKADEIAMYATFLSLIAYQTIPQVIPVAIVLTILSGIFHRKLSSVTWVGILYFINVLMLGLRTTVGTSLIALSLYLIALVIGNFHIVVRTIKKWNLITNDAILSKLEQWKEKFERIGYDKLHAIWHIITGFGFFIFTKK